MQSVNQFNGSFLPVSVYQQLVLKCYALQTWGWKTGLGKLIQGRSLSWLHQYYTTLWLKRSLTNIFVYNCHDCLYLNCWMMLLSICPRPLAISSSWEESERNSPVLYLACLEGRLPRVVFFWRDDLSSVLGDRVQQCFPGSTNEAGRGALNPVS